MFDYCYECGTKLEIKELEHEGSIPFCPKCKEFRFPIFSSAVNVVILNKEQTKTLFVKQYGIDNYRLVAGYINKGENAEEALVRELNEELGVSPIEFHFQRTIYFEKSNTLMINYYALLDNEEVYPNYEIDSYKWFDLDEGIEAIKKASLASTCYNYYLEHRK